MTDHLTPTQPPLPGAGAPEADLPTVPEPDAPSAGSVLGRLRARREELQQERHVDLPVPGYGEDLYIRHRPLAWEELKKIAVAVDKSKHPQRELLGQADTIIRSCETFLVRDPKGDLLPLGEMPGIDGDPLRPITFNPDTGLPGILGFTPSTNSARSVLFGLFSNDLAVTAYHNELAVWMQGADEETDEELLGE